MFLGFLQPVVELLDNDGTIKFAGLEKEKLGITANEYRSERESKFEKQYNILHKNTQKEVNDGDVNINSSGEPDSNQGHTDVATDVYHFQYATEDDIERIMKEIKDMTLNAKTKTLEGRLNYKIEKVNTDIIDLKRDFVNLASDVKSLKSDMKTILGLLQKT